MSQMTQCRVCGRYDSYDNESDNNRFDRNGDNFKILSKKSKTVTH